MPLGTSPHLDHINAQRIQIEKRRQDSAREGQHRLRRVGLAEMHY